MNIKVFKYILLIALVVSNHVQSQICNLGDLPIGLRNGLVAYYPFCASYSDISGNNYNATAQSGSVPFINDRFGNPSSAVQLGGGFLTANSAVFNFQRNQSFSVSIWFTKDNSASNGRLLSTECPEGNFRMAALLNGMYGVQYGDYISDTVVIGQWTHLVYTYENRSEKVYINGKLKYTNNDLSTEGLNYCAPFTIGAKASIAFDRWIGKADDLAIYNRVLTGEEVNQLYTNGTCTGTFNIDVFPDVLNVAGKNKVLDAGAGFISYVWNTGSTQQTITTNTSGFYKVTVTDQSGCTASDSTFLNLINAEILQNDTSICSKSDSLTLSVNSTNVINIRCTGFPTINFKDWTLISPPDFYVNFIKNGGKYFARSMTDVLQSNFISGQYTSMGFAAQIGNNLAGQLLGVDKLGRIHIATAHSSLYVLNGNVWSPNGLSGFGTGGQNFVMLNNGRLVISKGGFLRDIYYSDDNGNSWINATNVDVDWSHITVAKNGHLFAGSAVGGTSKKGLLRSTDNGNSWVNISDQLTLLGVTGINIDCNGNLFVAADLKLLKSVNSGANWTELARLPNYFTTNPVYGKLLVASNDEIYYYGIIDDTKKGLFSSYDGGKNWIQIPFPGAFLNEIKEIDNQIILVTSNGVYAKTLSSPVNIVWSTGETTSTIKVKPSVNSKYYVTFKYGNFQSVDSVSINVGSFSNFNPLPDTIRLCGTLAKLDAGVNYKGYTWSTGETLQTIEPKIGGKYFVTVSDQFGCTASDSTYLSLVNANILQNDTTICNGAGISLSVDTIFKVINTFGSSLPANLKNDLVAYYPFNGNANDESGNNNHATVYNARLTADRYGRPNSAYSFSPGDRSSIIPGILNTSMVNSFTYSVWVKPLSSITIPSQGQASNAASGFPNNTCVIHPIHGQNYGPADLNTGTGVYVGTNGVYLEEHSAGWEAVPISHQINLTGWHLINIVYENKIPTLYIDGVFIKKGIPSSRQIYASLGPDGFPFAGPNANPSYNRSGIGAGYIPATGTTQYFNGDIDDIFFYRRALSSNEVTQIYNGALSVRWSTGDTTSNITVTPSVTTKYFVTVSDGITTCTDSILVKVNNLSSFNPLPDTISQCGKSVTLDAGGNFQTYNWSNGASGKSITVSESGRYTVNVKTAEGCTAADTAVVSLVYVNIDNNDTTVCAPVSLKLQITDTLVSKKGGWELLIPASNFNFSETNFREGGFDPENAKLYSVLKNGSVNRFYLFDLNTNSVQTLESNSPPGEIYDYTYDFINSRIIGTRVGRDRMYSIPLNGGTWTPFGNGSFDAESYGCATYWNPVSGRPGFFGGYGFFSVKNWVWENNGNAGWQNVFANTNNCQPPKRIGQIARNKVGDKLFIFSGQGSCDGNQFASSCSLSQPWATDVGIYCWLKDLWELDLNTYSFKNILPPNSPSIVNEGSFAYDYNRDVFYNIGGYKPLPTYSPSAASNLNYEVEVYQYRRGLDNGFELMPVEGIKPPILKLSQYSGRTYFDAKYNRVIWARNDGIWALNLGSSSSVSYKYKWSTGDTTTSINVSPTKTTTYYVNVTDGITTCTDSVKVTVDIPVKGIRYPTQDLIIGRPNALQARSFGATYLWSPDLQINSPRISNPIITPTKQQEYTVKIVTKGGCTTVDTLLVRVFPERNIYVPTGFTPDSDGKNDRLYPILVGIQEIRTFRIYNRWGVLLYENKNANIGSGWDGTFKGISQPMDSYVWVAEGIDIDGKFIRRSGNSILIR